MGDRITIVVDHDVNKAVRDEQAKLIKEESGSVSYSRVVNDRLRKSYKLPPKEKKKKNNY